MADRIPLIINSSAQQIQELPPGDNLVVDNLKTTGIITATKFVGDGSGLTNLAGIGTASGIVIQEEGTSVGTATTINFVGTGVTATISGGIASVEITSGGDGGGSGISNVVEDTSPELGGNLNVNGNDIVSASNGNIEFTPNGTGKVVFKGVTGNGGNGAGRFVLNCEQNSHGITIQGPPHSAGANYTLTLPNTDGNADQVLKTNGSGVLDWVNNSGGGGISNIVEDTTPQLGGNLDLNGKDITGTGGVNLTGTITATAFSGPATQVNVDDESSDTTCFPLFATAATGNLAPKSGSNLTFNSSTGTLTATTFVGGGALQSRTVVTGSTSSIINNATDNVNLTGFKSYALMKVGLSANAWIRLYTDSTSRTNDASRSVGEDPLPGSGVIAEVVGFSNQLITPFVIGGNMDGSPSTTIYAAITNLSGTTQVITANLTILQLEQ